MAKNPAEAPSEVAQPPITGISSMATRHLLAELAAAFTERSGMRVAIESAGGVDARKRVEAGEDFDVVFLASEAIDGLMAGGHLAPGSRVDLVRSKIAIAVPAGSPRPDVGSEEGVRRAVLAARSVGHSTGPSGVHLQKLFERWGIAEKIEARLMKAPPGVPVGTLVARGDVTLGFQQLSELLGLDGIQVVGTLPPPIEHVTVFSAGIGARSQNAAAAREMLAFMASSDTAAVKRRHGMEPA